jgi:uncharacterized protein (TIGR03435 family)
MANRISIAIATASAIVLSMLNIPVIHAQVSSGARTPDAPLPTFEVASVKKHSPENDGGKGKDIPIVMSESDVSQFRASNVTAKMLIATAFGVREFQISGGPGWIDSNRFDVEAKVEDSLASQLQKLTRQQQQAQQALMLRSLLLDRFALEVTRGTKEGTILALVVARGGPKLKEVPPPNPQDGPGQSSVPVARGQSQAAAAGQALMMMSGGSGLVTMASNAVPIATLVNQLSARLDQQVVDQTGLKGTYQYTLRFVAQGGLGPDGMPLLPDIETPQSTTSSVFTALQEQLGLKLESTKGPVETITIDHIEEPSPN